MSELVKDGEEAVAYRWGVENRSAVETHVNNSVVELDARDRARLVVLAYQTGLVIAGEP